MGIPVMKAFSGGQMLDEKSPPFYEALADNGAYHALESVGGLIRTGPTGTNVNDISVGLIG